MTTLGTLPNELARAIASTVDPEDRYQFSLVNRQFHSVTNPYLWHSIGIHTKKQFNKLISGMNAAQSGKPKSGGTSATTDPSLSPLGSMIRHVHLDSFLTDKQFLTFMKYARYMEELILMEAIYISDASTRHLPLLCPNLKYLTLNGRRITQRSFEALGQCRQLSTLFLVSCPGVTTDAFHALTACPLKNMMTYACGMVNHNDGDGNNHGQGDGGALSLVGNRTFQQSVLDLVSFNELTSLALVHCPPDFIEHLFTTLMNSTRLIWPNMKKLSLNGCPTLPEFKVIHFIRSHPRLTVFSVEPNSFTDLLLDVIGTHLHGIQSLGMSGSRLITPHGVRKLIKRCPDLEQIRLFDCGMNILDFPEASYACLEPTGYFVNLLDDETIAEIRLIGFTCDENDGSNSEDDLGQH